MKSNWSLHRSKLTERGSNWKHICRLLSMFLLFPFLFKDVVTNLVITRNSRTAVTISMISVQDRPSLVTLLIVLSTSLFSLKIYETDIIICPLIKKSKLWILICLCQPFLRRPFRPFYIFLDNLLN